MALIRRGETSPRARSGREWDPFQAMREMMGWDPFQDLPPLLAHRGAEALDRVPAFDVRETRDGFVFTADLPGFREEDLDVNINGNRLTISGSRQEEDVLESDTYYCRERSHGSFSRSFTLPDGVDTDRIRAELRDGILSLQVPKSQQAQPRRIPIGAAEAARTKTQT